MRPRSIVLLRGLACLLAACVVAAGARGERNTTWYVLSLDGHPIGALMESIERTDDVVRTRTVEELRLRRDGRLVRSRTERLFEETADGRARRAWRVVEFDRSRMEVDQRFEADGVAIRSIENGRVRSSRIALPDRAAMTPAVERAFIRARVAEQKTIAWTRLDATSEASAVAVKLVREEDESIEVDGRPVPVTRWRLEIAGATPVVEWRDARGDVVAMHTSTGMGTLGLRRTTERAAKAVLANTSRAPEIVGASVVKASKPIPNAERTKRLRLLVTMRGGTAATLRGWIERPRQKVLRETPEGALEILIDIDAPWEAHADDLTDDAYTEASTLVDADDPEVRALARRTVSNRRFRSELERVEALRVAVDRHIRRKDLGSAFASASQTVRDGAGDCTEHAVLLCALLRASGVPSRAVAGLVYADRFGSHRRVFAWHMWTQALVEGQWVDLDATRRTATDATHIAFGTLALGPNVGQRFARFLEVFGALEIEVLGIDERVTRGEDGR